MPRPILDYRIVSAKKIHKIQVAQEISRVTQPVGLVEVPGVDQVLDLVTTAVVMEPEAPEHLTRALRIRNFNSF
jgi:hypothetical protein